jgi:ABC-type Na+ efflux pump permease subunit
MIRKIIKWDLKRIFSSKKFTAAFILQFFLIVLLVPIFTAYLETLQTGRFFSTTPGMKEFVPMGISEPCELSTILEEYDQFDLVIADEEAGMEMLQKGTIVAYILVDQRFDEKISTMENISVSVYYDSSDKSYVAKSYLDSIIRGFSDGVRKVRLREHEIDPITVEKKERREFRSDNTPNTEIEEEDTEEETETDSTEPPSRERVIDIQRLEFSLSSEYIILLIMLLPLFMSGGLLTDSVVSEKEKKTGEMLLVLPTHRRNIILGKMLAIFLTTVVEILLWIFILYGFGKLSSLYTIFPLALAAFLVINLSLLISVYSQSYKESALLVTVVYVIIFAAMFGTSILYVSEFKSLSLLSPLSMVIGLERGTLTGIDALYSIVPALSLSLIILALSLHLFRKDSFYFGPRPGILTLIPDIFSIVGKGTIASLVLGTLTVFGAMIVEILVGAIAYYFGGLTVGLVIFFIAVPIIEEYLKYLAMLPNNSKFSGVYVGLGFGICEAILPTIWLLSEMYSPGIILLRIVSIFIHVGSSGILGYYRYMKKTRRGIVIAIAVHLAYNTLMVVMA